ncbi:MAG: glycerol-3-phosphate acyltransferase [bacterium]|nr:glycerol-3-phosphate acyltransferase [bacterium]
MGAYAAASLNFAIALFSVAGKKDPRFSFSGNPGTMNVYRQAGLFWGALVLLLDVGRAVLITWIGLLTLPIGYLPLVAGALIMGNRFPFLHKFKGGKGVANLLGFSVLIAPVAAGVAAIAWVIVYKIRKVSYIASFVMIAILAIGIMRRCDWQMISIIGTIFAVGLIVHAHKQNIFENRVASSK